MFDAEEEADDYDGRSIPSSRRGRRGDYDSDSDYHAYLRDALSRHREDLAASEMKKFDALLLRGGHQRPAAVDHGEEEGGGVMAHSIASARTLHAMGEVLRDMNDLVGAAEAYKECLDAYLEGSIAGGADLRARLLEREARDHDSDDHRDGRTPSLASEAGVDLLSAAGDALRRRREFLLAARGARCLLAELGCVRFVGGPGAASSRGRRRRRQDAARAENLRNAVASLSLRHPEEEAPPSSAMDRRRDGGAGATALRPTPDALRSRTWSSPAAAAWSSLSSSSSSSGPNPVRLRRAITSEEEADRYLELSARAAPAEGRLAVALRRFPLPDSVFAAAAGGARGRRLGRVPGDGVAVAEGGTPPPPPPPPARDDDHGTSPRDEALQRIIPREWLEEGSCGGGGAILPDPTSSSSSSMDGTSMMDPTSSSSSMDGTSMMDLALWGARGSTTSNIIFDMISPQIVM